MSLRRGHNGGFTIMEAVVVIIVVTLLAAIFVPMGYKTTEDIKKAKAQADCAMIAEALKKFRDDVGIWPVRQNGDYDDHMGGLISGPTDPGAGYGFGSDFTSNDRNWVQAGSAVQCDYDLINNQLVTNTPEGDAGSAYPTTGQYRWRGPYLELTPLDPWGYPYVVSMNYQGSTVGFITGWKAVISAGPNGDIDTDYSTFSASGTFTGDDIGVIYDYYSDG